jgi:hypothetical protein
MRSRTPLFVLLASSLTFLASLFLPWRETTLPTFGAGVGTQGLLNQFSGSGREYDGWATSVGDVAVLLVVALVLVTVAALRRPQLAARLPVGSLAVALGYFAVALAVTVHTLSGISLGGFTGQPAKPHASWTYGAYLGLASAGIALLDGLAYRRRDLLRPREAADVVACVLGVALLISFLLPWVAFGGQDDYSVPGIESPTTPIAALGLVLGAGWLLGEGGRRWRLPFAIATAILTGGAASALAVGGSYRYGTWIGIACAVVLVALEAVGAWPVRLPAPPRGLTAPRLGAAALLVVALFLPWQKLAEGSISFIGWYVVSGAAAGALCLLLLATPAVPALEAYVLDTAIAVALLVSALGTAYLASGPFFRMDYGAIVGFVGAGVLLVTALVPFRPVQVDKSRAFVRAVPLALAVLCVASIMVPWWFVLPRDWTSQALPLNNWLGVAGLLLALYLVRLWALQMQGRARTDNRLTFVPLVLLTLPALELIRLRDSPVVIWGAIILVGLCLLLAVFGWVEEDRTLETVRVPDEFWRVDRLPEPES